MAVKSSSGGELPPDPETPGDSIGAGRSRRDGNTDIPAAAAGSTPGAAGRTIGERRKRYLVAPRQSAGGLSVASLGLQPAVFNAPSFDGVEQALRDHPEIDFIGSVGPRKDLSTLSTGAPGGQGVLVARMSDKNAARLHQQGAGTLLVERDQHLYLTDAVIQMPGLVTGLLPDGPTTDVFITVLGRDNMPVAGAEVSVFGAMLPVSGVTNANGQVVLALSGEASRTVSGLYVKPKADYWSFYQRDPDISIGEPNVVALRALSDWPNLKDFPQRHAYGWGQKAMRLDQLPPQLRGQGIKVAVIDSGAATTHQNLEQLRAGVDILQKTDAQGWRKDDLGHGSHCSAVIGGAAIASGMRGFAPEAELHECKLFPGGQISQLIDALEYCIENQIDVVNLSLGGAQPSEALEQQIIRAKRAGIACIVAAGNSGGPVQYPASSPNVLAVAAIGKLGEFPPDSYHAQTLTQTVDANGYYQASFSCFGPQVAVCAPGVAITSAVPANNFAAWDGTSMAAPHVTGLAALVLAHHPDFQSTFKARGPERVERLFQLIKMSARPVTLADPEHTGYGMPDVLVAIGLQAAFPYMQGNIGASRAGAAPTMGNASAYPAGFTAPQPQSFTPMSVDPRWAAASGAQGAQLGNLNIFGSGYW
ncbi:S8 family serine peptidase [Massilia sp. PWRC2]|uniref:S8 family serine peptidase n=1 Tax=Massilia sp. PWRC2 TaxID=2804626 RepID=UPI003CEA2014